MHIEIKKEETEMKKITEKEMWASPYLEIREGKHVRFRAMSKKEAKDSDFRTICVYLALSGLRFRPIKESLENANLWLTRHTKEDYMKIHFGS